MKGIIVLVHAGMFPRYLFCSLSVFYPFFPSCATSCYTPPAGIFPCRKFQQMAIKFRLAAAG